MTAERFTQRLMQKVRRLNGWNECACGAPDPLSAQQRRSSPSLGDFADVNEDALAQLRLRVLDCDSKTFSSRAGIALLAARDYSIEQGLVDYDRNNIAFSSGLYFRAIADKRE